MSWTTWIGMATGIVMVVGSKIGPPPVILDLGPVVPTPAATPKPAEKKRLITIITVQNSVEGESVVSFEATDMADEGVSKSAGDEGATKSHVIASKSYSFADQKPELKELSDKIMEQIRKVERDMLEYAERAGPPKVRDPVGAGGSGSGTRRAR
jgi:hypothetical protein